MQCLQVRSPKRQASFDYCFIHTQFWFMLCPGIKLSLKEIIYGAEPLVCLLCILSPRYTIELFSLFDHGFVPVHPASRGILLFSLGPWTSDLPAFTSQVLVSHVYTSIAISYSTALQSFFKQWVQIASSESGIHSHHVQLILLFQLFHFANKSTFSATETNKQNRE